MYNRPYTMHSYSKKNKEPIKEEVKSVGIYTTKETRNEVAKEIKRTHFQFGSEQNKFPQSLNQDTYQDLNVDDKTLGDEQKRMSKINKKSNFIFGTDPPTHGTSNMLGYMSSVGDQYRDGSSNGMK